MEQLNSNIERVIEANTTIEVLNVGAFFALVKAYKYVAASSDVDSMVTAVKVNVPFTFDLYNKDNDKISTGTISPGEKATFKVATYKMLINNTYDYDVHIVFSFGSGTVDQLKTDLELTVEDLAALTQYDKPDFDLLTSINTLTFTNLETLAAINAIMTAQTAVDKTSKLIQKVPIFISLDSASPKLYFNAIDLTINKAGQTSRPYFITHIDVSFDYSQVHGSTTKLTVSNTFNPAMSFGKYAQLKDLAPMGLNEWNALKWTNRADNDLPTKTQSLVIDAGKIIDEGNFRVDINEVYGDGTYFATDNFILKTSIVYQNNLGLPARKTAIRKYVDPNIGPSGPAGVTESWLGGTYNMNKYNRCTVQKPTRTVDSNMIVIDVCIYGYLLPIT